MDQCLGLSALDEAVAVGVEILELGLRAGASLFEVRPARHVARERRLGDLQELLDRQLAVLVGVELLERLHAVLQEVGAGHLAFLVRIDLDEPLRQRDRRSLAGLWRLSSGSGGPRGRPRASPAALPTRVSLPR